MVRARDIIEAVVHPDPEVLKAQAAKADLSKYDVWPGDIGRARHTGRIELEPGAGKEQLAHELVHRGQFKRAGVNAEKANTQYCRTTGKFGDVTSGGGQKAIEAYVRHPWELMAYAHDTVAELLREYSREQVLELLRTGNWMQVSQYADIAGFLDRAAAKRFMRYAVGYAQSMQEAEDPKSVFHRVTENDPAFDYVNGIFKRNSDWEPFGSSHGWALEYQDYSQDIHDPPVKWILVWWDDKAKAWVMKIEGQRRHFGRWGGRHEFSLREFKSGRALIAALASRRHMFGVSS